MLPVRSPKRSSLTGLLGGQWIFLCGAMLTSAFYLAIAFPAFRTEWANRLFFSHPMKPILTSLFFWGTTAIAWKALRALRELRVLRGNEWSRVADKVTNITDALALFGPAGRLPRDVVESELGHRL